MDDCFAPRGRVSVKEIDNAARYPRSSTDGFGRLRVGASVGAGPDIDDHGGPGRPPAPMASRSASAPCQWKSRYGGMEASDLKRVRELEAASAKLKWMCAELALDNAAMKDLIAKKL